MRYNYNTVATYSRLSSYTSNKASYQEVERTLIGYFAPVSLTGANDVFTIMDQQYQFITDGHVDIAANDKLFIGGETYGVKGVARFYQLSQYVLVCSLVKDVVT